MEVASSLLDDLKEADIHAPILAGFPLTPLPQLCSAILSARGGDTATARRALDRVAARVRRLAAHLDATWSEAPRLLGAAALAVGQLDLAHWTAGTMRGHADSRSLRLLRPEGMWLEGMVLLARDQPEPAHQLLAEAT